MPLRSLLMFVAVSAYASESVIMLGVLEGGAVRVVFQKKGSVWQPFPSDCPDQSCLKAITKEYPATVTWTIAFSGRSLGQLTAATPNDFEYYSSIGLQKITSNEPIPAIGKRPLVAISQPNVKDPDAWKRTHPSPALATTLHREFREKFPDVSNCSREDTNTAEPWHYRDTDMKLDKAYSSNKRWFVVKLLLTGYLCDGPPDDPFLDQWFAIAPTGATMYLGQGLSLVDAGDYDNDRKSELVFAIDRYNQGGYELFYDDFKRHATFQFTNH
jgi:hypothetical protein